MKPLSIPFALLIFLCCFSCQERMESNSNVTLSPSAQKRIKTKTEFLSTIDHPDRFIQGTKEFYDENGRKTSEECIMPEASGYPSIKTEYKYKGDQLIEEIEIEGKQEKHTYFDYTSNGKIRKKVFSDNQPFRDSSVNELNAQGNIIRSIYYENGDSVSSTRFYYDKDNNLIEQVVYDPLPGDKWTYVYRGGLKVEQTFLRKRTGLITTYKYQYDEFKKLIGSKTYFQNSDTASMILKYEYEYY